MPFNGSPNKRKFLFAQQMDKASGVQAPQQGLSMPVNKSAPKSMSPGLPNPMGISKPSTMGNPGMGTMSPPKLTLPNPTAAPSLPSMPKNPRFAKLKKALKPTKEF
jgi:hypothetical protein